MKFNYYDIFPFVMEIIVFLLIMVILELILREIKNSRNRIFNPREYFPEEEIHSLRQIFYLIIMGLIFISILYSAVFIDGDLIYFVIFDILLCLFLAVRLDKSTLKNKILLILLIPYGSLSYMLYGNTLVGIVDFIHIPVLIYFIKIYYDKFREYTLSNGLGITILLLFTLVFISFLITQPAENVNPLDSLVMVSNAFTSNGYAILGSTILGKIDAIILVWGGYLLSGVGTATLTSAILTKHFNDKFDEMNKKFEELEDSIKKNE